MTDNDVIKSLETCMEGNCYNGNCKYFNRNYKIDECMADMLPDLYDLINRKKAEIERLQEANRTINEYNGKLKNLVTERDLEIERLQYANETNIASCGTLHHRLKDIKVESIKRFAYDVIEEIDDAIHSNYNVIEEREKKHNANRYEDGVCLMCDGKISAMLGLKEYIFNTIR